MICNTLFLQNNFKSYAGLEKRTYTYNPIIVHPTSNIWTNYETKTFYNNKNITSYFNVKK